jgi:hypothetical protein
MGRARAVASSAVTTIRSDAHPLDLPALDRLRAPGKAFKVIVVAVMRKLLMILNLMLKKSTMASAASKGLTSVTAA